MPMTTGQASIQSAEENGKTLEPTVPDVGNKCESAPIVLALAAQSISRPSINDAEAQITRSPKTTTNAMVLQTQTEKHAFADKIQCPQG
ncbi:MAG: hypothetical protein ACR2N1_11160 [Rubripirellula sp.]